MRVLLVNSNRESAPWPTAPVGICKIASVLEEAGFDVRVLDLCFSRRLRSRIKAAVKDFQPEAIGLSIRNIDDTDSRRARFYLDGIKGDVIDICRSSAPAIPLVIGGSAIGIAPEQVLRFTGADFAVVGDGERAALGLFSSLRDGEDPSRLPGVVSGNADNILVNDPDWFENLDAFPFSRMYAWLNWPLYAGFFRSRYGIQTKRGCDRSCVYCSYPRIEGRRYRLRDPRNIAREIREAFEEGNVTDFEFVDSTFNIPRGHAMDVCREIERLQLDISLDTMGLNPGRVDGELLEAMIAAGFSQISCTPESASPRVLKGLGKGFSVERIAETARLLNQMGLPTLWYFMFGGPGETGDTVRETFAFMDEHLLHGDALVLAMTGIRVLPGTPLAETLRGNGYLDPHDPLLKPIFYYGEAGEKRLHEIVAREVARRPGCIHASGEPWNIPYFMRFGYSFLKMLKLHKGTGHGVMRGINRIRRVLRLR